MAFTRFAIPEQNYLECQPRLNPGRQAVVNASIKGKHDLQRDLFGDLAIFEKLSNRLLQSMAERGFSVQLVAHLLPGEREESDASLEFRRSV